MVTPSQLLLPLRTLDYGRTLAGWGRLQWLGGGLGKARTTQMGPDRLRPGS